MTPLWLVRLQRAALVLLLAVYSAGYAVPVMLLLLLTVVAQAIMTRRSVWEATVVDPWIGAFLVALLISGWASPFRPVALGSTGLAALTIFLAFVPLTGVVRKDPAFLRRLLAAWVAGGAAAAIWAIALYARTKHPAFTPELGQNAVGTTLLIALILAMGLLLESHRLTRLLAYAAVLAIGTGLALTFTRGAWLGAATGLVTLFALTGVGRSWKGLALVVLVLAVGVGLDRLDAVDLGGRLASITDVQANENRLRFFRFAGRMFLDHPVTGTGLNTFSLVFPRYSPNDPWGVTQPFAHNIVLNMAAEGGTLGVLTFLGLIVMAWLAGWRWYRQARAAGTDAVMPAVVLAAYTGAMVHQMFDGTLISVHLGVGLWILAAVLALGPRRDGPTGP